MSDPRRYPTPPDLRERASLRERTSLYQRPRLREEGLLRLTLGSVVMIAILVGVIPGGPLMGSSAARAQSTSTTVADARLRTALDALDRRDFDAAIAAAGALTNPLARKLILWARFKEGLGAFESITEFMEANPDWPHQYSLRRAAERSLTGQEDPKRLRAWFDRYPPLTTDGMVAQARLLQAAGRTDDARRAAREAWKNGHFSAGEQKQFLAIFHSVLRPRDHEQRLSTLVWNDHGSEAKRMYPLVSSGYRALARARLLLRGNKPGVDGAVQAVPASLRDDPGLVFDRMVWRRKHDLFDGAIRLLFHASANLGDPDAWARERAILARDALNQGKPTLAYRIASQHGHSNGLAFATGEWMAGWVALRFLHQPEIALKHFETMYKGVSYPQSVSRAAYWAGRAAQRLKQGEAARTWYRRAADHAETFYGQLAIEALGDSLPRYLDAPPQITDMDRARFAADDRIRIITIMEQAGRTDLALPFVLALNDDQATPGFRTLVAQFLSDTSRPDFAVFFARRVALDGTMLPKTGYPVPPAVVQALRQPPKIGTEAAPEPALLLALIRQESNFNTEAVSRVGARGLMQLMPRTARVVAARLKEPFSLDSLTKNPTTNVRYGTTYFAGLLEDFGGSYVLAIAGYNAGPQRARAWRSQNGDPRRMTTEQVIDWIEQIPFSETRNYIQRVLEGTQVYRHRLGEDTPGVTLRTDLQR